MTIVLIIAAVLVVWWIVGSRTEAKQHEAVEQNKDLAVLEYSLDDRSSYFFMFPSMTVLYRVRAKEYGDTEFDMLYHLRRRDDGRWRVKLRQEDWEKQVGELNADIADPKYMLSKDTLREQLAELGNKPKWGPVAEEIAAVVETHYQRFLRHWKKPID